MHTARRLATKPFVVMPLIAVLVLSGWWLVLRPDDAAETTNAAGAAQVVEASLGSLTETVSAEGTLAYAQSEDLSFSASGTVTEVLVEAGQAVTEGDVLATLDSPELAADVASAETAVAEADARLADDVAAGASDAQLAADETNLVTTQDRLADAQTALEGAQLLAPFDGTVSTVDLVVGEELGSGGTSGTSLSGTGAGSGLSSSTLGAGNTAVPGATTGTADSTAQIQVVTSDRFVVEIGFDDTDIEHVTEGQEATISLSTSTSSAAFGFPGGGGGGGFPGRGGLAGGAVDADADDATPLNGDVAPAAGAVAAVSGVADASSGVASFPVTVEFVDDSGDYHAGASVVVELSYGDPTRVVQVPSFAVSTADDGSATVTVRTANGDETREVVTGDSSGNMITIVSGLEVGEQVVLPVGGGEGRGGVGGVPGGLPGVVQEGS